jgi:hypothetical protein
MLLVSTKLIINKKKIKVEKPNIVDYNEFNIQPP